MSKMTARGRRRSARSSHADAQHAAAAHAERAARQRAEAGRRVRVADRAASASAASARGQPGQREQAAHHRLHLRLRGPAAADDGLLDLAAPCTRCTGKPASTAAAIAAPRAWPSSSVEFGLTLTNTFSTATSVGRVLGDHVREVAHDDAEPHRQARRRRCGRSRWRRRRRLPGARSIDAEAGDAQTRVDAEDAARSPATGVPGARLGAVARGDRRRRGAARGRPSASSRRSPSVS